MRLFSYTYDQLNRLVQKSYPDTTTVNYTYDNDSRLRQVTDPTGAYPLTFDPSTARRAGFMGRLTGTSTQYAFLTSRAFTTSYGGACPERSRGGTRPRTARALRTRRMAPAATCTTR